MKATCFVKNKLLHFDLAQLDQDYKKWVEMIELVLSAVFIQWVNQ